MKVLVLSMVPERDWITDGFICEELKKLGHTALLRKYLQDGRSAVILERPDVVVLPVVRCQYTRDFAIRLKGWGVKVVARRSEAGVTRRMFDNMPRHQKVNQLGRYEYKDLVDMELVWGREFADILIDNGMIRSEQVRLIGGITLDAYYRLDVPEMMRKIAGTREDYFKKHGFNPAKKTLFFVAGFKTADFSPDYNLPEAEPGDPIHKELYEKDRAGRNAWIEALNYISDTVKDKYNILLRPHPGELLSEYQDKLPKDIVVSLDGNAAEGLVHCDILIHAGSTMAAEAHLLNKPAVNYFGNAEDEIIGGISPKIDTPDELLDYIESVDFSKSNASIKDLTELEQFYGKVDGGASTRAAYAINEFSGCAIETSIPDSWPDKELGDYETEFAKRAKNLPQTMCIACKKPFFNLSKSTRVQCPHCSISVTVSPYQVKTGGTILTRKDSVDHLLQHSKTGDFKGLTYNQIYEFMHKNSEGYQRCNQGVKLLEHWYKDAEVKSPVLEYGCGNGILAKLLADLGFDVYGVDVIEGIYDRRGYRYKNVNGKIPYKNAKFSMVLSFDVLEHIREVDLDNVLSEVFRVGRRFVFSIAHYKETEDSNTQLHETVKPPEWWLDKFKQIDTSIQWQTKPLVRPNNKKVSIFRGT